MRYEYDIIYLYIVNLYENIIITIIPHEYNIMCNLFLSPRMGMHSVFITYIIHL